MEGFDDSAVAIERAKAWQQRLADGGWAALSWPRPYGGRGASVLESMVFNEELARYDVPSGLFTIGISMIGPTIITHGSEEQKQRYLPPMRAGAEIWCQLWSEPGAGSDLASLRTAARLEGDEFVLNGQKVWTSGAHYCDFGFGIFRTDPDVPKHHGLSCLVVALDSPGITIRPLRQMTGEAHFNEVFFDDVRVPAENLVGVLNDGWRVGRTMMMNERVSAGSLLSAPAAVDALRELAGRPTPGGEVPANDGRVRQVLARLWIRAQLFDLMTARVRGALARAEIPGPESSVLKLAAATFWTEVAEAGVAVLGPAGTLVDGADTDEGRWAQALLACSAMHIGGGTDQIQRNIIGETVLGLPREPAVDRDTPFRELIARSAQPAQQPTT